MTIKKTLSVKRPALKPDAGAQTGASAEPQQSASATIADRFRLDVPETPKRKGGGGGVGAVTLGAALAALAVAGILTFVLYQHWEFLKGA